MRPRVLVLPFPILALAALAPARPARGAALTVTALAPTGTTDRVSQVTAQFSEAMVPLGRMERDQRDAPLDVRCGDETPAGSYRWLDPRTVALLLERPLPPSTGCTVLVKKGARALSGAELASDVRESFETKRVELVRSQPYEGAANQPLGLELTLTFNQAVRRESLLQHLRFAWMGGGVDALVSEVPQEAKLPVDAERSYLIKPRSPLPKDTAIELRIGPGIASATGPLPSLEDKAIAFRTYGAFRVVAFGCEDACRPGCDPDGPVYVELSTPVSNRDVRRYLRVTGRDAAGAAVAVGGASASPGDAAPEPGPEDEGSFEGEVTRVYLSGPWQARGEVSLAVDPALRDVFGQTLEVKAGSPRLTTAVGARWPIHDLGGRLGVFEARSDHRLPLLVRNVPDLVLRTKRLGKDEVIPFLRDKKLLDEWESRGDSLAGVAGVKTTALGPFGKRDVATYRPLDLDTQVEGGPVGGLVYLDVSSAEVKARWSCEKEPVWSKALVEVTDIALSVKLGKADTLVLATSLRDAIPLPGTRIELRNEWNDVLWRGETGPDGVALAPGEDALVAADRTGDVPALWVMGERGGDFAVVHAGFGRGLEAWAFGLEALWPGAPRARAHTVTESPIYKPGEVVHFRTLVRKLVPEGLQAPEPGSAVNIRVTDSQGEVVHEAAYHFSRYGSVHGSLALAAGAHLGTYRVEAVLGARPPRAAVAGTATRTGPADAAAPAAAPEPDAPGPGETVIDAGSFLVEQYRPATVKLEVEESETTAPSPGSAHVPGDCARFTARARYHFGGALSEGEVRYTVASTTAAVRIPGLDGFAYGEPYRKEEQFRPPERQQIGAGTLPLSAAGEADFELPLPATAEPQSILFEAETEAQDGRPVAARTSFVLHPAGVYVGLRPARFGVAAGETLDLDVLAARPDGVVAAGVHVEVEVLRRVWNTVRKKGVGSFYSYESHVEDTPVDALALETGTLPLTFTLRPPAAGTYVVVARARDERGNAAESTTTFYVWGGDVAGFERYDHDRIDVVPDKASYLPGETAKLLVKSPFEEATALVTVEQEGVERYETRCVQGSAVLLELQVLASDAPTAFVSVLLLRGRIEESPGLKGADLGRPQMRLGYATLAVRAPDRKLAVEVTPQAKELRPGDTATVDLRVAGLGGARAELTVLALDEAVLDVAGSAPWDPFAVFWAPRPIGVVTADTRGQVIGRRHFGQKGEVLGGGGGESEVFRRELKASAFFDAAVETDAEGHARVSFKLPDNLTTFRVVALAATARDRFGTGEAKLLVTKPVVTTPSVPRFLEVGDRASVGVAVVNRTGRDGIAEVTLAATGVTLEGKSSARVALAAGASAEVRFPVRAERGASGNELEPSRQGGGLGPRARAAELRFTTTLNGESDALALKVPVEERTPLEVAAAYGSTTEALASTSLAVPASARGDRGGLEVALSSSLAVGLRGPVEWMQRYPWDCLEQRLSRAVTFVAAARYPDRIGLGAGATEMTAWARNVVSDLGTFQEESGLLAYWPGAFPDPYLTGYALETTRVLERLGVPADAGVRARATAAVLDVVREERWPWWYGEPARRETRAFLLAELAREGKLPAALLERPTAERESLTVFALAALLEATATVHGVGSPAYAAVRKTLLGHAGVTAKDFFFEEVRDDGLTTVLSSPVRGNAMALLVLAEREPGWDQVPALERWLTSDAGAGRWQTTHDVAWGTMATLRYLETFEKDAPALTATASLEGSSIGSATFNSYEAKPIVIALPMKELGPGRPRKLEIARTGVGRLYWSARLAYAEPSPPEASAGLDVSRRLERPDGTPVDPAAGIARGEIVRVVVSLTVPSLRHFIVLEDPLPAGFEAVNLKLATTAESAGTLLGKDADNDWISYQELRDDRAVAYAQWLEPGTHTFTYLARATVEGHFVAPGPHAEEMYAPETHGRGRAWEVVVRGAEAVAGGDVAAPRAPAVPRGGGEGR